MNINKLKTKLLTPNALTTRAYPLKHSYQDLTADLYIAMSTKDHWCKIGYSQDPIRRVYKDLKTYVPKGAELIETVPLKGNVRLVERIVLNKYRGFIPAKDQHGEWFLIEGSIFGIAETFRKTTLKVVSSLQSRYAYNQRSITQQMPATFQHAVGVELRK
tara:strand:+ start:2929 stop:3408 length:480 start_codon:yes stop_codon:yes gene_type:complete